MKAEIQVGKYKWETEQGVAAGFGRNARVTTIPGHDDVVAVFSKSESKRAWYEYLGILLGESRPSTGGWVFIIPKMEKKGVPRWYQEMSIVFSGGAFLKPDAQSQYQIDPSLLYPNYEASIPEAFKLCSWILDNKIWVFGKQPTPLSGEIAEWLQILHDFLSQNRQLFADQYSMDLNHGNVLYDGSKYIISDPIFDRANQR